MIRQLPDFTLFRLTQSDGLYVCGFGQAFEVSADMKNSQHVTSVRRFSVSTMASIRGATAGGSRARIERTSS
jgi:hypothetical protein